MTTNNLFKQAVAEAKSVREAAILRAKQEISENITPHLKSMIATRLQEMEEEDDLEETLNLFQEVENEEDLPEEEPIEEPEDGEEPAEEEPIEEPEGEEGQEDEREIGDLSVEEFKELIRDVIAQTEAEEDSMEGDMPAEEPGEDMDAGEELPAEMEPGMEPEEGEEEIDLDELLREMEAEDAPKEVDEKDAQLQEALNTINKLKKDLQEVNLLNAKLLYVSKVLKASNLTESQKVNVISAFDKAESVREAKLIYQTVSESVTPKKQEKKQPLRESKLGSASRVIKTPAVKKEILSEVDETVKRMQRLAGIIKD